MSNTKMVTKKSIFIQISSYHDYELPRTIEDAILKSSGENIINFGINHIYYEKNDIDLPIYENIKYVMSKSPTNIGVGFGRYVANDLYSGEDYYLQIDSHTRFKNNWDKNLIDDYNFYLKQGLNPVISAYPSSYLYKDLILSIDDENPPVFYTDFIEKDSFQNNNYLPHQAAVSNKYDNIFTRSISAGSVFSKGEISLIKPNKKMFFWGEEQIMAIRFFTHGYDLLLPRSQNFYHLYYDYENPIKNLRRRPTEDFPELCNNLTISSHKEFQRIVLDAPIGEQELGSVRTLKEYEIFAGINFAGKKIESVI